MPLKIVIADDHDVVRVGLKAIFDGTDIKVVAEAASGEAALKLVKKHRPDLVLLDVRMPEGDGLTCLTRIKLSHPELPVLMFSAFDSPTYIARAVALGAAGYLLKSSSCTAIVNAVRAAVEGNIWSKEELRKVTGSLVAPRADSDSEITLTKRESEVLKQLALGLTNKEIAQSLGISYETVKEHVQNILRKLKVTDRTQAAVWAVRKFLI